MAEQMAATETDLDGRVAIVTGASSGIGEATAEALAAEGVRIALAARREDELETIAERIREDGGTALVVPTDMTEQAQVEAMIDTTHDEFGQIDILVNNAGVMLLSPVAEADPDNWQQMVNVNLLGVLYATRATLPIMQEAGSGHIVTVSSVAGRKTAAGASVYNATKFGVRAFTEAFRAEVVDTGIRTTVIEPGTVDTELQEHVPDEERRQNIEERMKSMEVLVGDDIAQSIIYAVSQQPRADVSEILIRPTQQER
jgi:NADP-dependent 3-hydroxy acid dehydrogenase YdfG